MLNVDLWHRFIETFSAAIRASFENHLASVWSSPTARTKFYREMLKPLAVSLGTRIEEELETGSELFKVDFAISRNSDGVKVPIIFIESENNPSSADHEVRKLVNLAAPLRDLITIAQWDDRTSREHSRGAIFSLVEQTYLLSSPSSCRVSEVGNCIVNDI